MSQMIPMRWRPLPVFDGLPALLVAPNFGTATYTLHVTDLTNIWSETLDRKGVVRRSLNEDTSIDPTEGADQMAMLLSKLQAAFDPSAADYRQTSVGLSKPSHDDEGKILLTVTCTLPGGLKPLRWPFELSKLPAMSLASELVLPLIQAQHARIWEIRHLITLLEQKDAIIGKLSDKLESVGITLDTVFNPLSGKKKVTRELAEEKVQGFAPFQKADWQSRGLAEDEKPTDVSSLIREAFLEPSITLDKDLGVSDDLQDWWTTKLKSSSVIVAKSEELAVPAGGITNAPKTTSHTKDDNDDDDDFQVQATPPHLAARKAAGRNNDHDTTTDEDSETEAIPDSLPPAPENKKPRLGAIGKPKKELPEASTPPPGQPSRQHQDVADDTASESDTEPTRSPPQKRNVRLGAIGKRRQEETSSATKSASTLEQGDPDDATASESEEEAAPSKPKSPTPPREPSPPRKRGGLGQIGRRTRQHEPSASPKRSTSPPSRRPPASEAAGGAKPAAGRKLGLVGRRKVEDRPPPASEAAAEEAPEQEAAADGEASETEEQKATRKRQELAKELERKAAAGPAKKKRKF